jgi:uncharacterized protein YjfI (DUF2170 family)
MLLFMEGNTQNNYSNLQLKIGLTEYMMLVNTALLACSQIDGGQHNVNSTLASQKVSTNR